MNRQIAGEGVDRALRTVCITKERWKGKPAVEFVASSSPEKVQKLALILNRSYLYAQLMTIGWRLEVGWKLLPGF